MELNKKIVLFCVIIQMLFCEVHPVPDGQMNETKDDFWSPGGLGRDRDSDGGMGKLPSIKPTHQTSTLATLASQPMNVNLTSADRNQTGSEAGETLLAPPGGNETLPGSLPKTNVTHGDNDGIVTSNMTSPGDTITSLVTQEEGENATTLPAITYPDTATGNVTHDDNRTGILPVGTDTLLPVPAATLPPDGTAAPAVPGVSPEETDSNSSSSSLPNTLHPTQVPGVSVVTTLLPSMVGSTTLPPPLYGRTTTDSPASGMFRTTLPPRPSTTEIRRGWMLRTSAPHHPPSTTTVATTTVTTPRSSTHTHHNLMPPRRPAGGGEAGEGVEGDSTASEGRGEIAGMDPLALGIGICIPVLLIIVVILSVFCYRKYKKGGRGYITLDDFGTFEGMQNPNYDGEL